MLRGLQSYRTEHGRKRHGVLSGKNFAAAMAGFIVLAYATVVLACSCVYEDLVRFSNAQNVGGATVENTDDDAVGQLCEFVRNQLLASQQSVSNQSKLVFAISYMDVPVHEEVRFQTVALNGFRPPGTTFPHAQLSFQLHSVLRI